MPIIKSIMIYFLPKNLFYNHRSKLFKCLGEALSS